MLERDQEYALAKRWREHGDRDAANQLVTSHLRLAAKVATGYRGYGLPISEIISEGNVGLMQALNRFDPEKGFRFATYAIWWIRASIQDYVLRSWSLVKIGTTANQKKLFFKLRSAQRKISAFERGDLHPDQVRLIAKSLNVTEQDVVDMNRRLRGDTFGKSTRALSRKCEKRPRSWSQKRKRQRRCQHSRPGIAQAEHARSSKTKFTFRKSRSVRHRTTHPSLLRQSDCSQPPWNR